MTFHAQVKRLNAQQEQEGREWAHAPAHVSKKVCANVHNVGDVAHRRQGLGEHHSVV